MVVKKETTKEKPAAYYSMVRYLAAIDAPEQNWFTPMTVSGHLQVWVDLGYELFSAVPTTSIRDEKGMVVAAGVLYTLKYVG